MKVVFGIVFISFFACFTFAQETKPVSANIETQTLTSKVFNNTRTIRVLLPPGYHDVKNRDKSYPVLYLNDGITVFRRFNIEETVYGLINSENIAPLIIVGIDNGGSTDKTKNAAIDRANEFLPYPDAGFAPERVYQPEPPSPIGKNYPDFVVEVANMIKQKYRIKSGTKNTGIGGFSYGGVAALYTLMNKPDVFGKLLLESTPLWIGNDKQLLKDAQQVDKWSAEIYIGSGTNESPDEVVNEAGKAFQDKFIKSVKRSSPETKIKVIVEDGAKHEPSAWSKRFPSALQFLFSNEEHSKDKLVNIVQSDSATTDGKIEETEWKDASVFDLTGGGKVFFKHDGNYVYVAVRGVKAGWTHLYLSEGENADISVLHASAALGKVVYRKDKDNLWQPLNDFSWELRDRIFTDEVRQKMADYAAKNNWAANNTNMGNRTEVEFQLKLQNPANKKFRLAVVYAVDQKTSHFFPESLTDDSLKPELVAGNRVQNVKFDRKQWAEIVLENKKTKSAAK